MSNRLACDFNTEESTSEKEAYQGFQKLPTGYKKKLLIALGKYLFVTKKSEVIDLIDSHTEIKPLNPFLAQAASDVFEQEIPSFEQPNQTNKASPINETRKVSGAKRSNLIR